MQLRTCLCLFKAAGGCMARQLLPAHAPHINNTLSQHGAASTQQQHMQSLKHNRDSTGMQLQGLAHKSSPYTSGTWGNSIPQCAPVCVCPSQQVAAWRPSCRQHKQSEISNTSQYNHHGAASVWQNPRQHPAKPYLSVFVPASRWMHGAPAAASTCTNSSITHL
jgi:hypothetical protein